MTQNRGCFDRYEDEPSPHESASSPCYMHEVYPAYFGSLPPTWPTSDWKPNDRLKDRVPTEANVSWTTLLSDALSRAIGRHAATQVERVESRITARLESNSRD